MSWMLISKMGSIVTRVILVRDICDMIGYNIVLVNYVSDSMD